jgi:hypothetical protein
MIYPDSDNQPVKQLSEQEYLMYRALDYIKAQIEAAFNTGAFQVSANEYINIDITLRAETESDIKRSFSVQIEMR